ncbi:hypothetical protein H5410_015261 [Solanum commersonii]|uniref:Uncharacterized protein n=1 Tax=Solanum commersonii TaxID=4109 RepID=A0A9J5ZT21_SOLCO|nr:hypothetical protein H5410_015261 [Solanum commersonii]
MLKQIPHQITLYNPLNYCSLGYEPLEKKYKVLMIVKISSGPTIRKIYQYKELFSYMLDYSKKLLFAFDFRAKILKLSD